MSDPLSDVISLLRPRAVLSKRISGAGAWGVRYAQFGELDVAVRTERDYDSEFERQVGTALGNLGYEVHPQVGLAGFFIDLAIIDPQNPGRYLLGIECDGATYHSSRSAREQSFDHLSQAPFFR